MSATSDLVPIYRILIDTTAESFINDYCKQCGLPFRFVNEGDGTSFIMVDLAGLIQFSAGVLASRGQQMRPVVSDNQHYDHVVDFRGIIQ